MKPVKNRILKEQILILGEKTAMKKILLLWIVCFRAAILSAQESLLPSVLYLTGLSDASELDESVLAYYESLSRHPVRINTASAERLFETGLMTPFQAASLVDYRMRYGEILSEAELALIDGFNPESARALRPFLSFAPSGASDSLSRKRTLFLRGGVQYKSSIQGLWGARYSRVWGPGKGLNVAFRRTAGGEEGGSFSLSLAGRAGRLVLGDFHARYGQGLCLWSGLDLTSPTSLSGFSKRPGGIVASSSWSGLGTFRGLSYDGSSGPWKYALSLPLVSPQGIAAHLSRLFRSGGVGVTVWGPKGDPMQVSGDVRWSIRTIHLFGEVAYGGAARTLAGVGGALFPVGENGKAGFRFRAVPTGYSGKRYGSYSVSTGGEYRDRRNTLSATLEGSLLPEPVRNPSRRQLQGAAEWTCRITDVYTLTIRTVGRFRNYSPGRRIDFRSEAVRETSLWTAKLRIHAAAAESLGILAYAEAGRKTGTFSFWGRGTLFRADSWNVRLYCYERDLPGLFSVPAYWGRGFSLSAYGTCEIRFGRGRLRLYGKAGWMATPWQVEKKPGKAELRIQSRFDF